MSRSTAGYGYGDDSGGGSTAKLLCYLVQRFGPISSFSGSYRADRWRLTIDRSTGRALAHGRIHCGGEQDSFNSVTRQTNRQTDRQTDKK